MLAAAGSIGLTAAGSLLHLLGLMARVRRLGGPARTVAPRPRIWSAGVMTIVAVVVAAAAARGAGADAAAAVSGVLLAAVYLALGVRVVVAAARAVRAAPLRV
jgi:hypothetical protein